MTAKLTKELVAALHAAGEDELEVVDPETSRLYFIVDGETHRRVMAALRRQQDRDAIAQGIAEMEAGQGMPLAEAFDEIRSCLGPRQRQQ
jgi:predicted transcriptional regulator